MKFQKVLIGILHSSLFLSALFCVNLGTQARDIEPKLGYRILSNSSSNYYYHFQAGAPNGIPEGRYGTVEQAYEYLKSISQGPYVTFQELFPITSAPLWNGRYSQYHWHFALTGYGGGSGTGEAGHINLIDAECPVNYSLVATVVNPQYYRYVCTNTNAQIQQANEPDCDLCKDKNSPPIIGNPILPSTGTKRQSETDYQSGSAGDLRFTRTYRSDRNGWAHNYQVFGVDFAAVAQNIGSSNVPCMRAIGASTGQAYCFRYFSTGQPNDFAVQRGNGRMLNFGTATDFAPAADINDRVTRATNNAGATIGWSVYNAENDATERYDLNGRLQTITARNGQIQTLAYSDTSTPPAVAPGEGFLIRVTDQFGRQLSFTYDSVGRMATMIDPAGGIYTYGYNEASSIVLPNNLPVYNLTSVFYPDGKKRIYWYNEQDKTGNTNLPFALTGITDENGVRFASYKYDSAGRAISTEHAGSVDKHSVSYPQQYAQSTVTDPLGTVRNYSFKTISGVVKSTGYSQPSGSGSVPASLSLIYDANGNVASRTDFNGNATTYSYDLARNLETSRVEAAGTPQARTITTEWHPTYRLPTRIAESKRLTTNTYDTAGNLLTRTVQVTADTNGSQGFAAAAVGSPRTWSYTYNTVGQVLTATGPRTDVADVTTYAYDSQGNLITITNAANQATTLSNYDAHGRVGRIVDPNGLITDLAYSPRGWLTSKVVGGEATGYEYDGVGQLKKVTLPDASFINYTYDDAHRLTNIADSLGNRIDYTLDAMGNRTSEQVKDPGGALARQTSRVYDALNRLQQVTGGVQ